MTTNDPDIENAIRALRDAFSRKINVKDSEIITLRGECAAKDSEIKELQLRIAQLENQLLKADNRISDMSKSVSKLTSFKQQILESIADDDLSSLRGALGRERMSDGVRLSSPQSDQSCTHSSLGIYH
ncbi:hypothetical protein BKA69DRAFT_1105224 [Paraphysoderma sedebokerense]|nr:hypothetical protein BKA69DRAFT_1105224 [Paraphysoderma sedebokerense]